MRPDWDSYFMNIAKVVAERSTCPRLSVGAVIVPTTHDVIFQGYNGAPSGVPHCIDVGCAIVDGHCITSVHAECNALIKAGHAARGSILYTTASPCWNCMKLLINAGIKRVVYNKLYGSSQPLITASKVGIEICPKI